MVLVGGVFIAGMWVAENSVYENGAFEIKGYEVAWTESGLRVGKTAIQKARDMATHALKSIKREAYAKVDNNIEAANDKLTKAYKKATGKDQLAKAKEDTIPGVITKKGAEEGPKFEREFAFAYAQMINSRIAKLRYAFQWDYPTNVLPDEQKAAIEWQLQCLYDNAGMRQKAYEYVRINGIKGHNLSLYIEAILPFSSAVVTATSLAG